MDLKDVQSALNLRGWTLPLDLDGEWGPRTARAVDDLLGSVGVDPAGWGPARRILAAKQALCRLQGIEVGAIDGLAGPQTRYALDTWEARRRGDGSAETWRDTLPPPAPVLAAGRSVWPRQVDVERFYGPPGGNQTMLALPYPMRLAWEPATVVKRISVHEKVADSAGRVLSRALDHYGPEGLRVLGVDLFGGALNVRRMRGGSAWSMHSWGIAIDFDPDRNQLQWGRDRARLARPDAEMWWRLWEEEGWVSLGRARNYDWMHVQAARL